jgi:hypothetical protein
MIGTGGLLLVVPHLFASLSFPGGVAKEEKRLNKRSMALRETKEEGQRKAKRQTAHRNQ